MTVARESAPASELPPSPSLKDKVGFLSTPESHSEQCRTVSVLQTSHAWIFLTEKHVFKLKGPCRRGGFEYSSIESRRVLCEQEYALNLRLASHTYLGVVSLAIDERGNLRL
jgi:aminoglycoside phosphotransferase family enzyme